jgi:tartrate-resistant acid phosphatase type 5
MAGILDRRTFLRQSFAFSALAVGARSLPALAASPDSKAKHLLLLGDWGWEDDLTGQTATAQQMVKYAQSHKLKTEALFMLGDSWYGPMPGGIHDPRWKTQFEDMYPRSAFDCPIYSIMGNHDYQHMPPAVTKTEMELAYAKQPGTRWNQPALWYSFQFPQKNPLVTVIALDSNVPNGPIKGANFTLTLDQQAEQLKWFAAELAKPRTTPFVVVMGHHPIFSNGPHGDHKILIAEWEPLLRQHKVDFYLAGHDHDLQHLEFEGHPTSFVCSGAGGADLYDLKITESQRGPYAEKVYGFSHMELASDRITIRHIAADGRIVHAFSKTSNGVVTVGT